MVVETPARANTNLLFLFLFVFFLFLLKSCGNLIVHTHTRALSISIYLYLSISVSLSIFCPFFICVYTTLCPYLRTKPLQKKCRNSQQQNSQQNSQQDGFSKKHLTGIGFLMSVFNKNFNVRFSELEITPAFDCTNKIEVLLRTSVWRVPTLVMSRHLYAAMWTWHKCTHTYTYPRTRTYAHQLAHIRLARNDCTRTEGPCRHATPLQQAPAMTKLHIQARAKDFQISQ